MIREKIFPFVFLFVLSTILFLTQNKSLLAQSVYEPLNHHIRSFSKVPQVEDDPDNISYSFYSSFLPERSYHVKPELHCFYRYRGSYNDFMVNKKFSDFSWLRRKVLHENFIIVDTGKFYLTIDPLFNFSVGNEQEGDLEKRNFYTNTRGLRLQGDIGKKLSFETYFYENQAKFPNYITSFVQATEVVPGQGRVKDFKEDAFDFAQSGGYFSYVPHNSVSIQFGHHKHFIGDGHRSMILSDNSFNYPFLRVNSRFWQNKLRYSVLYAMHQDLVRTPYSAPSEAPFRRKGGAYHIFEMQFNPGLRFYVTQATIFPFEDSVGVISQDASMLNPVMFVNPLVNGMDAKANSILGFGFDVWPFIDGGEMTEIYGQVAADDFEEEKMALQLGLRQFFFSGRLYLQVEANRIGKEAYSSNRLDYNNSFVHYNQPLVNVLGNNSEELIFKIAYMYKRFMPDLQINLSDQKNFERKVLFAKAELAYILNPATNLKIFGSYTRRTEIPDFEGGVDISSDIIYFGIRTDLRNIYYDF